MEQNAKLRNRHLEALPKGVGTKTIYAENATNAELWDVEGKRFIDFAAGIAVLNTGHRHPRIMAAVAEQMERFTHTCFHVVPYEGYIQLAERLNTIAPVTGPAKTMFLSTGAEAVENAIKIARVATGRSAVIAFSGGFHGRTMMCMALTGKVQPYKKGFGPFPSEIYHVEFPNTYHGGSVESSLEELQRLFETDIDPERVAAIIFESVQGEGGFNPAPPGFIQAIRELADKHGILLIADEIQTGIARTGKLFCLEHTSVKADIITLAKGLAGGFPLSAVVGRADVMDAAHIGGLGSTYGGNPLAIAAANAVLDVIEEENLCIRAAEIGERITSAISSVAAQPDVDAIGDVRGLGAMVAFELVKDQETREPDASLATAIVAEAERRGLILLVCGTRFNVVRLLPPLTISEKVLDEALYLLKLSIVSAVHAQTRSASKEK